MLDDYLQGSVGASGPTGEAGPQGDQVMLYELPEDT